MKLGWALVAAASIATSCGSGSENVETPVAGSTEPTGGGEPAGGNSQATDQHDDSAALAPVASGWTARVVPSATGSDVVMEGPCATGRCALAPVPIGEGTVRAIGMLDLAGPPMRLDSRELTTELASARLPAFVCVRSVGAEGSRSSYLVIVLARDGAARVVLSEETPGHVSSLGTSTERGPDALDIVFVRTAMPSAGDREFRPGPPLTDRFRLTGETYTRVDR